MNKKIGFGIIGCGLISKWHAEGIRCDERAVLVGVTDRIKESTLKITEEYGCRGFETVQDMLECEEIQVVCICTPSGTHAPLAIQAAKSGKHVVLEKPMAITQTQLQDVIAAGEENGVKIAVISQLRFSPAIRFVKKAIEDGVLGRLISGDVYMKYYRSEEYYRRGGWRGTLAMDGGGALMNQGIHGIDLLQYLMVQVKSVSCMTATLRHDIEVEDTANVLVEFESGSIGVIQGTTSVYPGYSRLLSLHGTKGSVVLKEDTILKWDVEDVPVPEELMSNHIKYESFQDPGNFGTDYHALQISDMITAILENKSPMVDMYEGKKAVDIILTAYKAARSGKKEFILSEKYNSIY